MVLKYSDTKWRIILLVLWVLSQWLGSLQMVSNKNFESYKISYYNKQMSDGPNLAGFVLNFPQILLGLVIIGACILLLIYFVFKTSLRARKVPRILKIVFLLLWAFLLYYFGIGALDDLREMIYWHYYIFAISDIIMLTFLFSVTLEYYMIYKKC